MPRCEGRPNQTCSRNDSSVRSTQGDLFLCPDCEEFRFPNPNKLRSRSSNTTSAATTNPAATTVVTRNNSVNNSKVAVSVASSADGNGKARGKNRAQKKNTSVSANTRQQRFDTDIKDSDVDESDISYPGCKCNDTIPNGTDYIRCDGCMQTYHQECTGLPKDVFTVLKGIVKHTGWVCQQCRSELNCMQSALTKTTEELADIRVSLAHLFEEIDILKSNVHQRFDCSAKNNDPVNPVQSLSATTARDTTVTREKPQVSDLQLEIHVVYMRTKHT